MSQNVRAGPLVVVSGQVAICPEGLVGDGDPRAQAEQRFDNLEALLRSAGASRENVVKLTGNLVGCPHYPAYAEVNAACFGESRPRLDLRRVEAPLADSFLIKVEALAVV